ncbi:TOMM precursor leader peptide-binding protein [Paracidovorax anthurii]|uniref:Ribosomal protein S12 methylthiotransferase accessory factor n=1 Tax=Paracidovorax anthurii TaxID=78229 RepID=A0A328Z1W9_9BURK|nr:TOMM precursor leader peptide-binding protein [Paracidovorax anthurii]RAR79145.1 ribosomal protein S12 methylthiotransferase accessory factor [Paracidovorax anthurii]
MDWFHSVPDWHPRFRPVLPGAEVHGESSSDLVLVEEGGALRFPLAQVGVLAHLVASGLSPAAWCAAGGDPRHVPGLLWAMESLGRQGYLVERGAERAGWFVPDVQVPPLRHATTAGRVTLLTRQPGAVEGFPWSDWLAACTGTDAGDLHVLVCDDYFDPRLKDAWAQARGPGQPRWWLPVRVGGSVAIAGPLLDTAGQEGPCWHCFLHRLRRNSPERDWLARESPDSHGLVPLPWNLQAARTRLDGMRDALRRLVSEAVPGRFATLRDGEGGTPQWHGVRSRPQCDGCGDPGWMGRQARHPVRPGAVRALAGAHGGARSVTPEATVQSLLPWVDGVAGVVTECTPLPRGAVDAIAVYRSAFHPVCGPDGWPAAARWCLGKGMTDIQAQASALCEAVERYAACFQGDEAWTEARPADLPGPGFGPEALVFISDRQRARPGAQDDRVRRLVPHGPAEALAWAPAWSLTRDAPCFLPLAHCYSGVAGRWSRHGEWNSNGCAAGNCIEEAVLQGLLEVVERDATAIWWYNELPMPAFDLDRVAAGQVRLVQRTLGPEWSFWALDLTHDLGIPVVAAVGQRDGAWALGFGCSLDAAMACERALTELVQLVAVGKTLPAHWNGLRGASPLFLWPAGQDNRRTRGTRRSGEDEQGLGISADIAACVAAVRECGMEVVVHDYSRPDIPLRTVKTTLPGACHIWPELANPRLYRVPVAMGWRDAALKEEELNPWPLYV